MQHRYRIVDAKHGGFRIMLNQPIAGLAGSRAQVDNHIGCALKVLQPFERATAYLAMEHAGCIESGAGLFESAPNRYGIQRKTIVHVMKLELD